jgi:hypothetical protein
MKIAYTEKTHLRPDNLKRLHIINSIIDDYRAQGYVMTLRQLYYRLVARNVIANSTKEYAALSKLLNKGRMAGIVDWAAIEDRGRQPRIDYSTQDVPGALRDIRYSYKLDRMKGQPYYIEVWIEKDALSNVFRRVTDLFHINLMVNKGYSSASAMHDAYLRMKKTRKPVKILYFGDHDPSGKDMVRDIRDRMYDFGLYQLEVVNPALSYEQVQQYDLPENPVKFSDPRANDYVEEFGEHSWELDALDPRILNEISKREVLNYIDRGTFEDVVRLESKQKNILRKLEGDYDEDEHIEVSYDEDEVEGILNQLDEDQEDEES